MSHRSCRSTWRRYVIHFASQIFDFLTFRKAQRRAVNETAREIDYVTHTVVYLLQQHIGPKNS